MNISIITITFNNFSELIKTLDSTEGLNCERIVINGGQCEKTKALLAERNDIVSLSERDKGIADAFNKGVKLAKNKGVWILNSGDTCQDKKFVTFADQQLDKYDFVYSPITLDDPKGKRVAYPQPSRPLGLGMPYLHPGMIVHRKVFEEVGLFDLNFKIAMDYDLVCRMAKKNYRGIYYDSPTVLMDIAGISQQKLFQGHAELGRALRKSGLLTPNFPFYVYRGLKISARKTFYALKLGSTYEAFKKQLPGIWKSR